MEVSHHATLIRSLSPCDYVIGEVADTERVIIVSPRFGIDDARALIDRAYQRPREAAVQLLVVQTDFVTHEAQNALLKVLEEPPSSTKFFFVIPFDFALLPTLASRFHEETTETSGVIKNTVFTNFIGLAYSDRLATIDAALKKKDTLWQREMKQGLIGYVAKCKDTRLEDLEYVARLLLTRGASNKMLFEHAALILPTS